MKPINDWNSIQTFQESAKLPVNGYQVVILDAKEKTYNGRSGPFNKLEISFDILVGEYKNFFRENYKAQKPNPGQEKRWKGVLRLNVPSCDGSDQDNTTKRVLKTNISAIEESNPGYKWDWNENNLKGKVVGCLFRNEEWEMNGKTGWATMPYCFLDIAKVRSGEFTIPADKPLKKAESNGVPMPTDYQQNDFQQIEDEVDDLPF